jgi:hypothetical protein
MENLNLLSLLIATLIPSIIGFIYYGPFVFEKVWMESIGMTKEKQQSANMAKMMGISIVMSLLMAFFMLGFCNGPGQEGVFDTFKHGAAHGLIVSLFVVIPLFISNGLFEQRSWKSMLINGFYWLICFVLMGAVLDGMNHWPNVI